MAADGHLGLRTTTLASAGLSCSYRQSRTILGDFYYLINAHRQLTMYHYTEIYFDNIVTKVEY